MAVSVRVVADDVVGKSVGLRPGVLAVVGSDATAEFRVAGILIHVQDVVGIGGIFVRFLQDIPRVGAGVRVGESGRSARCGSEAAV